MKTIFGLLLLSCSLCCIAADEPDATRPPPAIVVFPIDQAAILVGSRFDFKVEFPSVLTVDTARAIRITVNGKTLADVFGRDAEFVPLEESKERKKGSALRLRDCVLKTPGAYTVEATDGTLNASVTWEVYAARSPGVAKNVILMVGDGMSLAHRTAARVLSKNIKEGKFKGKLAMDDMPHMALVGTPGMDSLITDSANSAHAYATGHKSSNAALGVYADRTPNVLDDPRVEPLGSLVPRMSGKAIGLVTDAEVQDATPGSIYAHTRRRDQKQVISEQLLAAKPDVVLGGGAIHFLPPKEGGRRVDGKNLLTQFEAGGYRVIRSRTALLDPATQQADKLLGLFANTNMDGVLDREFLKGKGWAAKSPDQPGLQEMTNTALQILSRKEQGFFLLIEGALIDKYSHALDWERSVMDTIQFDKTVAQVKEWAAQRNDTLVLVIADHSHGISLAGVIDDNARMRIPDLAQDDDEPTEMPKPNTRDKVGVYELAGFPNYTDENKDGYPDRLDVSRRVMMFFTNHSDYYETFGPKLEGVFEPTAAEGFIRKANPKYKNVPGAQLREGNIPRAVGGSVHSAEDVILTAIGPGSEAVRGFMDNTEVFRVIVDALGLKEKE